MSVDTERDLTGVAQTHRIHESLVVQRERLWWVAPARRPFFTQGLVVHDPLQDKALIPGDDYVVIHLDDEWSTRTQQEVGHYLVILDGKAGAILDVTAQCLGGDVLPDAPTVDELRAYVATVAGTPPWGSYLRRDAVNPDIEAMLALTKRVTFQHVVEATESIRQAILYGDADEHQSLMEFAIGTRTRYYKRILELLQVARDSIAAHAASNLGHTLTKKQVGLEHYPNFPMATRLVLDAGTSATHLISPVGFGSMLTQLVTQPLAMHYPEFRAHALSPTSIGLGNLHDFPPANATEAQLGKLRTRYMTPGVALEGLQYQFSAKLLQHIDLDDAHGVTPFQVGLGNYVNYPMYDPADFDTADIVNDQYLTPKGLHNLIQHHYWEDQLAHVFDKTNPHQLTTVHVALNNVTNLSRTGYDGLYPLNGHSHTTRSLPFNHDDLRGWNDTAAWVLDSRVTDQRSGSLWREIDGVKSGETLVVFPDAVANRVWQKATLVSAVHRQSGLTETSSGTAPVEQLAPTETLTFESAVIPWRTVIRGTFGTPELAVPNMPEEAWPLTEVLMTSTDAAVSVAKRVDVAAYVTRRDNLDGTHTLLVDEVALRTDLFSDVPAGTQASVTMFFTYQSIVRTPDPRQYRIDNAAFWEECKRLFPDLTHHQHEVSAELFFLTELPERLKGPDGVFFRRTGHYPYLRAQSTTKGDVGLGKVPNWSEADFYARYSDVAHNHSSEGLVETSALDNTLIGLAVTHAALMDPIKQAVWEYVVRTGAVGYGLTKSDTHRFTRAKPYSNPTVNAVQEDTYVSTHWAVYQQDMSPEVTSDRWVITDPDHQAIDVPFILPNTGLWKVTARHDHSSVEGGELIGHLAFINVDTGSPINPLPWVYDLFRTMLDRGNDLYGIRNTASSDVYWLDPDGVNTWLNGETYPTKEAMQKQLALSVITRYVEGALELDTPTAYANCVGHMDDNYPDWNWGEWTAQNAWSVGLSDSVSETQVTEYNAGDYDTATTQYRNATRRVEDPAADPLTYTLDLERRETTY